MKIAVACDHAGFPLKQLVLNTIVAAGHEVIDLGTFDTVSVDYPDFAEKLGRFITQGKAERGILLCGSGVGACIAANKIKGVRCTTAVHVADVKHNRQADDINVLALSADYTDFDEAKELLSAFLLIEFEAAERHVRRLNKIAARDR